MAYLYLWILTKLQKFTVFELHWHASQATRTQGKRFLQTKESKKRFGGLFGEWCDLLWEKLEAVVVVSMIPGDSLYRLFQVRFIFVQILGQLGH